MQTKFATDHRGTRLGRPLAAALTLAAGLAHFGAAATPHADSLIYALALIAIGAAQVAASALLVLRPSHRLSLTTFFGTLLVLAGYAAVHSGGLSLGLHADHAEHSSAAAGIANTAELALLPLLALLMRGMGQAVARQRLQVRRAMLRTGIAVPTALATVTPALAILAPLPPLSGASVAAAAGACVRTLTANVVAMDQSIVYNRLGVIDPAGMIFALRRDVVDQVTLKSEAEGGVLQAGQVQLRQDKRPRPLTLRMNVGDCLQVNLQNLIDPTVPPGGMATRSVGLHVTGMQLRNSILDDGSNAGQNPSSLAAPGNQAQYTFYAEREGTHLINSQADNSSDELIGTIAHGLFGAVNVEPKGAEWYRSQVTRDEMDLATTGMTAGGQPIINYDAVYPAGHKFAGTPILNVLKGTEIVHSDLTAIITGPGRGSFGAAPSVAYPPNPSYPNRNKPFREFTIVFHDEIAAVQAFPIFEDPAFEFTLHGVKDGFAINYGTGGVGAEIVANRLGVGPMWDCVECKYEEFFLTSWVVGDPAMVVDIPANAKDAAGNLIVGPKATKAFYPDDPSNVYHSYINDHTKFRNLHVGKEHHIFHLHSHQWLFTPDDDNSTYLDSQAIGPGTGYTYEIAFNGSGNRNKTPGDAIFHCHFYPHFAQGMWAMWRNYDTFQRGAQIDPVTGQPAAGTAALPDAEILAGTPIPGVVPLPGLPMAPKAPAQAQIVNGQIQITGDGNPGYPFFIAGVAGHRPPTPALDIVDDGGLPRHIITGGEAHSTVTPLDLNKELIKATAQFFPEAGTPAEQAAMTFHEQRWHPSFKPDGTPAPYELNGLPRTPGAPYAEPCRLDDGAKVVSPYGADNPRIYKGANIQFDMHINKKGWHTPQARIVALWGDVQPTLDGTRPPEPFVMRANTGDCINFYHTNLVPNVYEQDAFQVKTPTDVIGQHIHLVKFDVTSSDGSGNGWNYEDGSLSPDEVRERIRAIRAQNLCAGAASGDPADGSAACPVAKAHPFFGAGPGGKWLGARTTVQRWYADPVVNNQGVDRTLGNVFTHDHYGPSTHQQIGLFSTLIIEPTGSQWRNSETGAFFGVNQALDGGPTSWRADILTADPADSFREFYFEFADFHLAYEKGRGVDANGRPIADPQGAINPPGQIEAGLPDLVKKPVVCPNGTPFLPNGCPEAIAAEDTGTFSVNYRNEPLALRVRDPNTNSQAAGDAGDLSWAFSSGINRADPDLNVQPNFYPPLTGDVGAKDPYTPLLRAYANDRVRIRVQVGAHEEGHNVSIHGIKWLQEYASPNSGWRNSQMMGISEQFIFDVPMMRDPGQAGAAADYLYSMDASVDGHWNGAWGLLRAYGNNQTDLLPLPNNLPGGREITNRGDFRDVCPVTAPIRAFNVTAVAAQNALAGGTLTYNSRTASGGPLHDPTAILYVRSSDLDKNGKLKAGVPVEPLILRANAGDCIMLTLKNQLPAQPADMDGFNMLPPIVDLFNANDVRPSGTVGLHAQLVEYDVTRDDGINVGQNNVLQTVQAGTGRGRVYQWYAGDLKLVGDELVATPVEFGAINLTSSDRIKHSNKGAIGALIIEPQDATWAEDTGSRASATVTLADGSTFRDFVLLFQDDLNLRQGAGAGQPLPIVGGAEDAEDSGNKALNYRTEPLWHRLGIAPDAPPAVIKTFDFTNALSNSLVGGDPQTPVFTAKAGTPTRLRVLQPGGHARNHVPSLHGHIWEREPYINGSTQIGSNPLSEWRGSQEGHGPTDHWDFDLKNGAGGAFGVTGDYLFRDFSPVSFYQGIWAILRVTP